MVEALQSLHVDQISEFSKLAQYLLTSNLLNPDYEAILLCHKEDMEHQREKIVDEAERDDNVDAWINAAGSVSLEDALKYLRDAYLISLGSNTKTLSPTEVFDVINDAYKGNLKASHYLGKGVKSVIVKVCKEAAKTVSEIKTRFNSDFPQLGTLVKDVKESLVHTQKLQMKMMDMANDFNQLSK